MTRTIPSALCLASCFGALLVLPSFAHADEAPVDSSNVVTRAASPPEPVPPESPLLRSRLGAWQLHMSVIMGVEPVDGSNAVAFGASTEFLYHCRIGVVAALSSSKGNAIRATPNTSGTAVPAPGDRISVPFGLAFHPFGYLGMRPGDHVLGWFHRLAAGIGLQVGPTVEHIRDSGSSATHLGLHAALGLDIPIWGGPVEGGILLDLQGRLIVAPKVLLESGNIQMPIVGGQFYGGLTWAL